MADAKAPCEGHIIAMTMIVSYTELYCLVFHSFYGSETAVNADLQVGGWINIEPISTRERDTAPRQQGSCGERMFAERQL